MSQDLTLRCACGTLRGRASDVGPRRSVRLICHCGDCQSFARYLHGRGHAGAILDAWGGTEIVQISPARIELNEGSEQLACMRLSEGGLMRWYAGCCHTPVANTLANARVPFAGVIQAFADPELDAGARDGLLGPVRARVNASAELRAESRAEGPRQPSTAPRFAPPFPLGTILRSARGLVGAWIRGEQWPNPFFDGEGEPRARPKVLSEAEREMLASQG